MSQDAGGCFVCTDNTAMDEDTDQLSLARKELKEIETALQDAGEWSPEIKTWLHHSVKRVVDTIEQKDEKEISEPTLLERVARDDADELLNTIELISNFVRRLRESDGSLVRQTLTAPTVSSTRNSCASDHALMFEQWLSDHQIDVKQQVLLLEALEFDHGLTTRDGSFLPLSVCIAWCCTPQGLLCISLRLKRCRPTSRNTSPCVLTTFVAAAPTFPRTSRNKSRIYPVWQSWFFTSTTTGFSRPRKRRQLTSICASIAVWRRMTTNLVCV